MNTCGCGALIPNGVVVCTECRHADYTALVQRDVDSDFDDEAFNQFLDEGE